MVVSGITEKMGLFIKHGGGVEENNIAEPLFWSLFTRLSTFYSTECVNDASVCSTCSVRQRFFLFLVFGFDKSSLLCFILHLQVRPVNLWYLAAAGPEVYAGLPRQLLRIDSVKQQQSNKKKLLILWLHLSSHCEEFVCWATKDNEMWRAGVLGSGASVWSWTAQMTPESSRMVQIETQRQNSHLPPPVYSLEKKKKKEMALFWVRQWKAER